MSKNSINVIGCLLVAAVLGLSGCGGSGGGTTAPTVTPISQSATGSYTLKSSTSDYTKSTGERLLSTSTPTTTPPMSGVLTLKSTTWTETLNLTDGPPPLNIVGSYTFSSTGSNAGNYIIRNSSGTALKTGTYTFSDPATLTIKESPESTTVSSGAYAGIYYGSSNYVWTKVSD